MDELVLLFIGATIFFGLCGVVIMYHVLMKDEPVSTMTNDMSVDKEEIVEELIDPHDYRRRLQRLYSKHNLFLKKVLTTKKVNGRAIIEVGDIVTVLCGIELFSLAAITYETGHIALVEVYAREPCIVTQGRYAWVLQNSDTMPRIIAYGYSALITFKNKRMLLAEFNVENCRWEIIEHFSNVDHQKKKTKW